MYSHCLFASSTISRMCSRKACSLGKPQDVFNGHQGRTWRSYVTAVGLVPEPRRPGGSRG